MIWWKEEEEGANKLSVLVDLYELWLFVCRFMLHKYGFSIIMKIIYFHFEYFNKFDYFVWLKVKN